MTRAAAARRPGRPAVCAALVAVALLAGCGSAEPERHGPHGATTTFTGTGATTPAPLEPPAQLPAQPPPATEEFGVNVNRLFNDRTYTPAQIDDQLAALQRTGATVARSDALWEWSEPAPPVSGVHRYDWSFDDAIAAALAARGLQWLAILDYSALWDESVPGQDHSPPRTPSDYAAYAQAFAARYGAGGTFWSARPSLPPEAVTTFEIWNEPDNGQFWTPTPDAAGYAHLYLAARAAIDAVDPTARVIVGGLAFPTSFLPAMLAAEPLLAGHVDGVAIHPYGDPAVVQAKVRGARATLISLGMSSVPLYVTEFGWTTAPPGALDYLPAGRRAADIVTTLSALGHLGCGLAAVLLYTWVTPERDPADSGDWFGIHAPDGADTPGTAAFAAGLRAASRPGPSGPACSG